MKLHLIAFALLVVSSVQAQLSATTSTWHGQKRTHQAGELIFEDNFDTLDFDTWQHEITMGGGGNWEFQVYWNNRTNSYARDSTLFLQPRLTADRFGEEFLTSQLLELWGGQPNDYCTSNNFYGCSRQGTVPNIINPISSARLRTVNSFGFKYGRVETRAQLPCGDWIWPAIWMLPVTQEYGQWPTSGEIDIMESRGNLMYTENGQNVGAEQYGATLHYGIDYLMNGWPNAHFDRNTAPNDPYCNDFHTFEVLRYFSDTAINAPAPKPWLNTSPQAAYDFYQGKDFWYPTWFADGNPDNTSPDNREYSAMKVDYVRVYAL